MWEAYQECLDILVSYTNALDVGSKILLQHRELTGKDMEEILGHYPPVPLKKPAIQADIDQVYAPQVPSPLSIKYDLEEEPQIEDLPPRQVKETAIPK